MICDPRVKKLARLLVRYSTEVREGDEVLIAGTTASEPLLREVHREVLEAGGHPHVRLGFEDEEYLFYAHARDHHLDHLDPLALHEVETADVFIRCFPDQNPHALSSIDSHRKQRRARARRALTERFLERWGAGELRWVGTAYPTPALAQEARLSLEEYSEFVFACGNLDADDPVAHWRDLSRRQEAICDRLNRARTLRYVGLDTDIRFEVEGRTWMNCDGKVNFPDGEVFTGMGGTVHLAIGAGIPTTGSANRSAIHWDMLKDMREGGEIHADGELIYRDGVFLG